MTLVIGAASMMSTVKAVRGRSCPSLWKAAAMFVMGVALQFAAFRVSLFPQIAAR